ncbi:type I secretion system permease/ATPase [Pseudomonas sp. LRF_L74]|uniref:type I secretion system permease/ATPase n=1 Tax=Pseudomonas sp. LRF_L74 TaxID=3369422 RepID=UPI003F616429
MAAPSPVNEILQALKSCRAGLVNVGLFSAVINLLMLVPALYMLQVYDRVLASGNAMTLLMLTLIVIGLFVFAAVLEWVRSQLVIRLGMQLDMRLNARVFEATFDANLRNGRQPSAQALSDLASLRQFATGNALFAFFDAPWFPVYLGVISLFSPWLGLLALGGAVTLVFLTWLNQRLTRAPLAEAGNLSLNANQQAAANLRQAEAIESMGMLGALRQRWFAQHSAFLARQNHASEQTAWVSATSKYLRLALQSLVLGLGAWLALDHLITPGMMIAGSILMGRVLAPIDQVLGVWRQWSQTRLAYERLVALLQAQPARSNGMPLPAPTGALQVEQLSAFAPGGRSPCLVNVGFSLERGEVLGIIGPSGSGKSSLARLLVGVGAPQTGKVRLDGADLQQLDRQALGPHIGYLPQDVQLFAGSIAENIARFSEIDPQRVIEAAQMAGVHELILRLPDGYDTLLGENGSGLSGGQKQRIGLARALYRLPALIVLDEPNANLDEAGEQALLAAIAEAKRQGRTLVLIAHKPALLAGTDKLLVLRAGQMQAFGPAQRVLQELQHGMAKPASPTPVAAAPLRAAPSFSMSYGSGMRGKEQEAAS